MSVIKMKPDGTVITSLRMPITLWERLKLQAVAERSDMKTIILRGVASELGEQQERQAREVGGRA